MLLLAILTHWAVSPVSDVQRLPDRVPTDGEKGGVVRIALAKDEYEPGSFVLQSDTDLKEVALELSEFKRDQGSGIGDQEGNAIFPKENIDLKVVKVWYQNGNAWFSYFADVGGFKLCPELLVNDENLIRVDTEKKANYARLVGKDGTVTERWINPPAELDVRETDNAHGFDGFFPMREDFRDAETLQPIALPKGVAKQIWMTVHATSNTVAGVYRGEVRGKSKSEKGKSVEFAIPVEIKVFDFVLPKPKTRVDPEMDFWITFYDYICLDILKGYNGGDEELAKRQYRAILKDRVAHGQNMHKFRAGYTGGGIEDGRKEAEGLFVHDAMKEAGMIMRPLLCFVSATDTQHDPDRCAAAARSAAKKLDRLFGHHDCYIGYGDEPGIEQVTNRYRFVQEIWQREGFKFFLASTQIVFNKNPHLQDWNNVAQEAGTATMPSLWNTVGNGKRVAWYATQHVASENPAFNRRQNGLAPWLNGFTALANYAHHLGPYNDASGHYKPMVYVYGIYGGPLDTIQWEGFREGIDDMRYATLMSALARQAEKSADIEVRRLGMKALGFLALIDCDKDDLDEIRMEMTSYILKLKEAL